MAPVIALSHIQKYYGDQLALDDLSLSVEPGEVFGFLGQNGAGKSTSIRILLGIIDPDGGSRQVLGAPTALEVSQRIGYLPEERGLYKRMSAERVIAYLGQLKGMDAASALEQARILLQRYGLGEAAKKRVQQLSKGMAQKVQVLSTLVHDPDLLILDEPFSGLDPVNQQVLEGLVGDMKRAGKTILFSTHVMQHAERLCDRVCIIAHGRDVFTGTVAEARALLPSRMILRTADDIAPLKALPEVGQISAIRQAGALVDYEIETLSHLSVERLVAFCAEKAIGIDYFTMIEPSLHDVFVHLVGDDQNRPLGDVA
ncbi:putative ABC transporter ATP-binding protein YhaQ [alpha proteobacterium Q-1]|nr:putative ABC transporter ATP-binding protein YhaQ [alpha proteobacterium Q-1]